MPYTPINPSIFLGTLPEKGGEKKTYDFADHVPSDATEVQVYIFVTTHDEGVEFQRGYYTMSTSKTDASTECAQYMNVATGKRDVAVNSENMWFPFWSGRKLKIHLTHPNDKKGIAYNAGGAKKQSADAKEQEWSGVFVIGYR